MSQPNTITRKEIAELAEVSPRTVTRNEQAWGLAAYRSTAKKSEIRYFRRPAMQKLKMLGVILSEV